MAVPTTYAELQTELAGWINRDDLTTYITSFIGMAEARLNRVLICPEREEVTTLSASAETVALPADFSGARELYLDADPKGILEQMSLAELRSRHSASATGQPQNFAIRGSNLILAPAPDTTYSLILGYYEKITPLSDAAPTNWLLTDHPDIYLYGSLMNAESFMVNDPRIALWKTLFEEAIGEVIRSGQRKSYSAAPQRIRAPQSV